jgi:hypothetical protein
VIPSQGRGLAFILGMPRGKPSALPIAFTRTGSLRIRAKFTHCALDMAAASRLSFLNCHSSYCNAKITNHPLNLK